MLSPSIQYVETDEFANKLILHGLFGKDPGAGIRYVRIEGTDLNVTKWENTRIEADILPEQSGDVWVQIVARKSNIRQLTRWDGALDYDATGPQTLHQTAKVNFRFRADVGKFRTEPAGPLQDRSVTVWSVTDATATKAHFAYSGQADLFGPDGENSHFTQWTGEGDIVNTSQPGQFPFLMVRGTIDTATRSLQLQIIPASADIFKYRSYGKFRGAVLGGQSDALHPNLVSIAEEMFDGESVTQGVPSKFLAMTFDDQWSLPAGQRHANAKPPTEILIGFLDGEVAKVPTKLTWTAMAASKPPREDESRAVKRGW